MGIFAKRKSKQKKQSKYRPRPRHPIIKALTVRSFESTVSGAPEQCIKRLERVVDTRLLTITDIGGGDFSFQFSDRLLNPRRRKQDSFRTQVSGYLEPINERRTLVTGTVTVSTDYIPVMLLILPLVVCQVEMSDIVYRLRRIFY